MDDLALRPATPGDDDALWALLAPVFAAGETYCQPRDVGRDAGLAYWRGGHEVFVAEAGGRVLGTYFIGPNQPGGGAHVCNCGYVTAGEAQGRGVAGAMLRHSLHHARALGFRAMQFNFVIATNTRAIALWARHGFDTVGRLPGAFRRPDGSFVDALVMYRVLT
ncbi:MAG: GNAT family N-acetyltransferase [Pseudomonadota bacterium]